MLTGSHIVSPFSLFGFCSKWLCWCHTPCATQQRHWLPLIVYEQQRPGSRRRGSPSSSARWNKTKTEGKAAGRLFGNSPKKILVHSPAHFLRMSTGRTAPYLPRRWRRPSSKAHSHLERAGVQTQLLPNCTRLVYYSLVNYRSNSDSPYNPAGAVWNPHSRCRQPEKSCDLYYIKKWSLTGNTNAVRGCSKWNLSLVFAPYHDLRWLYQAYDVIINRVCLWSYFWVIYCQTRDD